MKRRLVFPVVLISLLAPAVLAGGADHVEVVNPTARPNPPGQKQTAAYMILRNRDKREHTLVKASSPAAGATELHTVVKENGMMKMRPVEKIAIKAGGETRLQPGGLHIMLINLKAPLKEGGKITLTLTFGDGTRKQVHVPVRTVYDGAEGGRHH